MMEGGQWLWPPVEVGHTHVLPNLTAPGVDTEVVTLSLRPLVVEVKNFLTPAEATHMIARAKPHMEKSGVALKDADKGKAAKEFRTSSQVRCADLISPQRFRVPPFDRSCCFRRARRATVLSAHDTRQGSGTHRPARLDAHAHTHLARRIHPGAVAIQHLESGTSASVTRLWLDAVGWSQVLRYDHMEHYSAHHDFFDPAAYATNPQMLASVEHGAKNRLATVFFYLNNVTNDV